MPSPGRPPLPRAIFAFDDPAWVPPAAAVLDTNVVAEALLPSQSEHRECAALFKTLVAHQTTVVFNRLMETELDHVLFNVAMKDQHPGKNLRSIRADGRVRRRARRLLSQRRQSWTELLDALPWVRVELHEVAEDATGLIGQYGLPSYDAVHVATLLALGLTDMITRDHDFACLPQQIATLHTTSRRVGTMRRKRR